MFVRLIIAGAVGGMIASPAFADCSEEIEGLNQAAIEAETGASSNASGLPATEHQQDVLRGAQQNADVAGPSTSNQADAPGSPHQEQVLADGRSNQASEELPALMAQARDMAKAGDEAGCMLKVAQAKGLLGIE